MSERIAGGFFALMVGAAGISIILRVWVRPYATIPICCPREIVAARKNELRRSSKHSEDRPLYRPRLSESRRAAFRQIVLFCCRRGAGRDQPEQRRLVDRQFGIWKASICHRRRRSKRKQNKISPADCL